MKRTICLLACILFLLGVSVVGCHTDQLKPSDKEQTQNYRGETVNQSDWIVKNGQSDDDNGQNSAGGLGMSGAAAAAGENAANGGHNAHGVPR